MSTQPINNYGYEYTTYDDTTVTASVTGQSKLNGYWIGTTNTVQPIGWPSTGEFSMPDFITLPTRSPKAPKFKLGNNEIEYLK